MGYFAFWTFNLTKIIYKLRLINQIRLNTPTSVIYLVKMLRIGVRIVQVRIIGCALSAIVKEWGELSAAIGGSPSWRKSMKKSIPAKNRRASQSMEEQINQWKLSKKSGLCNFYNFQFSDILQKRRMTIFAEC